MKLLKDFWLALISAQLSLACYSLLCIIELSQAVFDLQGVWVLQNVSSLGSTYKKKSGYGLEFMKKKKLHCGV